MKTINVIFASLFALIGITELIVSVTHGDKFYAILGGILILLSVLIYKYRNDTN